MHRKTLKKKTAFTLLETLISFVIMSTLVLVLFQFYSQLAKTKLVVKEKKDTILAQAHFVANLEKKLSFLKEPVKSSSDKQMANPLYTEGDVLTFHYDKLNDEDPAFRGMLSSELRLLQNKIILTTWPSEKPSLAKTEVLLHNISSFSLSFFDADKKEWKTSWPKEATKLPIMVKICTSEKKKKKKEKQPHLVQNEYVIFLFGSREPVLYKDTKSI